MVSVFFFGAGFLIILDNEQFVYMYVSVLMLHVFDVDIFKKRKHPHITLRSQKARI